MKQNVLCLHPAPREFPSGLAVAATGTTAASSVQPHSIMVANSHERPVVLRPFQMADARPMYQAARESLGQLRTWMTWCRPDYSLADAEAFVADCEAAWEKGAHYSFAIVEKDTDAMLGSIGLNQINLAHRCGNVGYWIRDSAVGRGVATTASRLVARFALQELGLSRLEFLIAAGNIASQRVAQKAGARFEGLLRNRLRLNGSFHDAALYALVAGDFSSLTVLI